MNGAATDLTPEEWRQYLKNAITALHQNHRDKEALAAVQQANDALSGYDEAEAATPGERIKAGFEGGLTGLGQAVLDVPRSVAQTVMHPIQTVENLPKVPGALWHAITSDDPETVARGVGNVGSALLPFAKAGRAAPALAAAKRAATAPVRGGMALLERPGLHNELLRARLADLARRGATEGPTPTAEAAGIEQEMAQYGKTQPKVTGTPEAQAAVSDLEQARQDFMAGKISAQDYETAAKFARGEPLEEPAQPISASAPGSAKPMEPTAPTAAPAAPTPAPAPTGEGARPMGGPGARFIANSYKELEALRKRGIAPEDIKVNYWTRGGQLQQETPPLPQVSPRGTLVEAKTADLLESARRPETGDVLRQAIFRELQRRNIVGNLPGQLPPR